MVEKPKARIVITGNLGFVGSNTQKALEEKGYTVVGFDIKEGRDIRDFGQLLNVIRPGDKVLHLAAIARFAEADADPLLAYETNVLGCANVAKVCKKMGAERLIYSSTGSIYMPITQEPPITEDFVGKGNSVYGCSKYLGELVIKREQIATIILRYAHLYGEGKKGHGAIGGFIDRMERGLAPILYGGAQSNDFTYIKDIVQANLLALESQHLGQVYNIGSGEEMTTEKVFETMKEVFGYEEEFERIPQRSVDAQRFVYDISNARRMLGYNPEYNFEKGIKDYAKIVLAKHDKR